MSEMASALVKTESEEAAEEFVREYVIDAIERVPKADHCEMVSYVFQGHPESPMERRCVRLLLKGEVDAIVEQEQSRWEEFVDDGRVKDWEQLEPTTEAERVEMLGEKSHERRMKIRRLENDVAKLAYEEFESFPAPVDTHPEEEGSHPAGWFKLSHNVMHKLNYSLEDELEVCQYGIEHTLRNYAEHDSPERADALLDDVIERLEGKREEIKEGRLET